eukprot:gene9173-6451_t
MDTIRGYVQKWSDFPQPQKVKYLKLVAFGCYAFFLLIFVIYAFGGTRSARSSPTSLVLFVEAVPDALLAIRYLALRPDMAIRMIVVGSSSWGLDAFQSVASVNGFLDLLRSEGFSASVPVYYGSSMAMVDESFPFQIQYASGATATDLSTCSYRRVLSAQDHFNAGRLYGVSSTLVTPASLMHGAKHYSAALDALLEKEEVSFVVLGPATDAAGFLESNTLRRAKVKRVFMAGGAFAVPGDVRRVYTRNKDAEMNFFLDPLAASYIVEGDHNCPVTLVPLDTSFSWKRETYEAMLTARAALYPGVGSSQVVAASALVGFHQSLPHFSKNVSVALLTAVYVANAELQSASEVSVFPVAVTNTVSLPLAGQSLYYPLEEKNSTVVLRVKQDTFWEVLERGEKLYFARMAQIIDGKAIAAAIRSDIRKEVDFLQRKYQRVPGFAAIIVGERKDSQTYVRLKYKAAAECGYQSFNVELPESATQQELESAIDTLNNNPDCHGIIVQLPLPQHINEHAALLKLHQGKDVDAALPVNVGLLHCKGVDPLFLPCTPAGIIEMLQRSNIPMAGKRAVVLGRSNIVGAPVAALLMEHNATVTIVHSGTPLADIEEIVGKADIVVSAIGKPGFVKGGWLKEGAAVIDVGTTPVDDPTKKAGYRLAGDVDFESAKQRAGFLSPVPGGVGPMTIAMLLRNTLRGFKASLGEQ